jgi:hypothetical protein
MTGRPRGAVSVAARFVRMLFRPRPRPAAGTLAEPPAGSFAVVESVQGDPALQARLTT